MRDTAPLTDPLFPQPPERISIAGLPALSFALALGMTACSSNVGVDGTHDAGADASVRTGPYDECGNGMDDDNDGQIDEGCFCGGGETQPCFTGVYPNRGVGACADGVQACDATSRTEFGHWGACTMDTLPAEEACDGVDNDCDGAIDEGCPCTAGQTQGCGSEFAIAPCSAGTQTCGTDGTWSACEGAVGPSAEVCGPTGQGDGVDNDCDGERDEGCDCVPTPEVCGDGVDNDCDGERDEAACEMSMPDAGVDGGTDGAMLTPDASVMDSATDASSLDASAGSCGTGGETLLDLAAQVSCMNCRRQIECLGAFASYSQSECEEKWSAYLEDAYIPLWQSAIDSGASVFESSAIGRCVRSIERSECNVLSPDPRRTMEIVSGCMDALFVGRKSPGSVCTSDVECLGGFCGSSGRRMCPGECFSFSALGEFCRQRYQCESGLVCEGNVCTEPTSIGASCGGSSREYCDGSTRCAGRDDVGSGVCLSPADPGNFVIPHGETCLSNRLYCANMDDTCALTSATSGVCASRSGVAGGSCVVSFPDGECPVGQFCLSADGLTGTCTPRLVEGSDCAVSPFGLVCGYGMVCDVSSRSCRNPARLRGSCAGTPDCASGNCRDGQCSPFSCSHLP